MSHRPSDRPDGADSLTIEHETVDRIANAVVTLVPLALLGLAIWLAWAGALHWQDLVVLAVSYILTVAGITVGYHRLFTHRSFRTSGLLRALFAVLGSAAVEGPVIEWVSTHRKHYRFSDRTGDPHSPTRIMASAGGVRCGVCSMPTSAGCSAASTAPIPSVTPRICSPIR